MYYVFFGQHILQYPHVLYSIGNISKIVFPFPLHIAIFCLLVREMGGQKAVQEAHGSLDKHLGKIFLFKVYTAKPLPADIIGKCLLLNFLQRRQRNAATRGRSNGKCCWLGLLRPLKRPPSPSKGLDIASITIRIHTDEEEEENCINSDVRNCGEESSQVISLAPSYVHGLLYLVDGVQVLDLLRPSSSSPSSVGRRRGGEPRPARRGADRRQTGGAAVRAVPAAARGGALLPACQKRVNQNVILSIYPITTVLPEREGPDEDDLDLLLGDDGELPVADAVERQVDGAVEGQQQVRGHGQDLHPDGPGRHQLAQAQDLKHF